MKQKEITPRQCPQVSKLLGCILMDFLQHSQAASVTCYDHTWKKLKYFPIAGADILPSPNNILQSASLQSRSNHHRLIYLLHWRAVQRTNTTLLISSHC